MTDVHIYYANYSVKCVESHSLIIPHGDTQLHF